MVAIQGLRISKHQIPEGKWGVAIGRICLTRCLDLFLWTSQGPGICLPSVERRVDLLPSLGGGLGEKPLALI